MRRIPLVAVETSAAGRAPEHPATSEPSPASDAPTALPGFVPYAALVAIGLVSFGVMVPRLRRRQLAA